MAIQFSMLHIDLLVSTTGPGVILMMLVPFWVLRAQISVWCVCMHVGGGRVQSAASPLKVRMWSWLSCYSTPFVVIFYVCLFFVLFIAPKAGVFFPFSGSFFFN